MEVSSCFGFDNFAKSAALLIFMLLAKAIFLAFILMVKAFYS